MYNKLASDRDRLIYPHIINFIQLGAWFRAWSFNHALSVLPPSFQRNLTLPEVLRRGSDFIDEDMAFPAA